MTESRQENTPCLRMSHPCHMFASPKTHGNGLASRLGARQKPETNNTERT